MAFSDYGNCDGLALAELVRKKKVSPSELVEEAISRIEKHNSKINAVVLPLYERAREKAKGKLPDGPFKGVPFMIKDLHATIEGCQQATVINYGGIFQLQLQQNLSSGGRTAAWL